MSQREYFGFRGSADEAGEVRVRTNVSGTSTRLLLQGNGTVTSSVTNNGTVGPQGSLTVTGNYTQTSGGALNEQFGSTLHVNGNATLSGYLFVRYSTKVPPKSGSTYTAMTFSSLSGEFTNVSPGTAKYTNNSVVVKFP